MRICMIAAALIALPVLTACGSDKDSAAPAVTQADLAKSLQDKGLRNQQLAECAARVFVDQGISQEGLRIMMSDKYDSKSVDMDSLEMSASDKEKTRAASSRIATECMGQPQTR